MAKDKSGSVISALARWRSLVQAALTVVWLYPWARLHTVCSPVFHCHACPWALFACPIGVMATFSALHIIPYIAIGTLIIYGAVFGSFICGWICPFGFLQDLLAKIPTPKFDLPAWMGYFRYAVLALLVLAIPYFYGEEHPLFICRLCPAGAVEAAVPTTISSVIDSQRASQPGDPQATEETGQSPQATEIKWPSATKIAILVVFLGTALFVRRPWCTVFCPLGVIYGLFNRVSIFFLKFHPKQCNECDRCRDLCQYGGLAERRAGDQHCIRCMECAQCKAISVGCVFTPAKEPEGES